MVTLQWLLHVYIAVGAFDFLELQYKVTTTVFILTLLIT